MIPEPDTDHQERTLIALEQGCEHLKHISGWLAVLARRTQRLEQLGRAQRRDAFDAWAKGFDSFRGVIKPSADRTVAFERFLSRLGQDAIDNPWLFPKLTLSLEAAAHQILNRCDELDCKKWCDHITTAMDGDDALTRMTVTLPAPEVGMNAQPTVTHVHRSEGSSR